MPTFKRLRELKSILEEFPGVKTYKELDILIEIGYHQEIGSPLTMKQLSLLDVASQATVRRCLHRLIHAGFVEKGKEPSDHRAIVLYLSEATVRTMVGHFGEAIARLSKVLSETAPVSRSQKTKRKK